MFKKKDNERKKRETNTINKKLLLFCFLLEQLFLQHL